MLSCSFILQPEYYFQVFPCSTIVLTPFFDAPHVSVEAFTDYLKSLSPSTLDVELRMLQIIDDDDEQEPENRSELVLELIVEYLIHEISFRNNFEFIQAVIRLFLKVHTLEISTQVFKYTHHLHSSFTCFKCQNVQESLV